MWAENLPNGKIRFVERYENPITGKKGRVSVVVEKNTAGTRKEAFAILSEKIDKTIAASSSPSRKPLRLHELVALYQEYQKDAVEKSTYTRNCYAAKSLMRILGEDALVDRLTAGYVRQKLALENESPGTVNERIARFKALIRWGYENDYIADIRWLDKIKKLKDEEKTRKLEEKFLEGDQLKELLDTMSVDRWMMVTKFLALSGLRVGELIALKNEDVDLENRIIHVNYTYDYVNDLMVDPKTKDSIRSVFMQEQLYDLCKQIKIYIKRDSLLHGYRSNLFLPGSNGKPFKYYAYNKYLREITEKLFQKRVTTHFMRHTHVALMAEQGVSLDTISRRLGHADSSITRQIYFHVTEKLKERDYAEICNIRIL